MTREVRGHGAPDARAELDAAPASGEPPSSRPPGDAQPGQTASVRPGRRRASSGMKAHHETGAAEHADEHAIPNDLFAAMMPILGQPIIAIGPAEAQPSVPSQRPSARTMLMGGEPGAEPDLLAATQEQSTYAAASADGTIKMEGPWAELSDALKRLGEEDERAGHAANPLAGADIVTSVQSTSNRPKPATHAATEDSWTPFAPMVADWEAERRAIAARAEAAAPTSSAESTAVRAPASSSVDITIEDSDDEDERETTVMSHFPPRDPALRGETPRPAAAMAMAAGAATQMSPTGTAILQAPTRASTPGLAPVSSGLAPVASASVLPAVAMSLAPSAPSSLAPASSAPRASSAVSAMRRDSIAELSMADVESIEIAAHSMRMPGSSGAVPPPVPEKRPPTAPDASARASGRSAGSNPPPAPSTPAVAQTNSPSVRPRAPSISGEPGPMRPRAPSVPMDPALARAISLGPQRPRASSVAPDSMSGAAEKSAQPELAAATIGELAAPVSSLVPQADPSRPQISPNLIAASLSGPASAPNPADLGSNVSERRASIPPGAAPPAASLQPQVAAPASNLAAADGAASPAPLSTEAPGPASQAVATATQTDAANAKRARGWWDQLFDEDFIRLQSTLTPKQLSREVDFIEESLGLTKGASILDLGCGTGDISIELARRGYAVVGYDASAPMLARAWDNAQAKGQRVTFTLGDMRELHYEDAFDGVVSWNASFGYFEEEKNAHVADLIRRSLRKGGPLLLDVANRDYTVGQSPSSEWFAGEGWVCMDEMQLDWISSRLRVKRKMMLEGGRAREIEYSIRLYSLHELGRLLHDHGFRVTEVSGLVATPGVFFGAQSPRTIVLAEKR